jgi:hypothetical protein
MSEVVTVTGSPTLWTNTGRLAHYLYGSGTNTLTFSYSVGLGSVSVPAFEVTRLGLPLGTTVTDLAGNAADHPVPLTVFSGLQIVNPLLPAGVQSPVVVSNGGAAEIEGASALPVTFAGSTGSLTLDNSLGYTGQVSGLSGSDSIDLADIAYGANTTASFSGNSLGGTLSISDGGHTANIALQGNYLSSGWTLSSDGNGGTVVVDPPLTPGATAAQIALLSNYMASTFTASGLNGPAASAPGSSGAAPEMSVAPMGFQPLHG